MNRKEYLKKLLDEQLIDFMWSDYIGRTIQSCISFTSELFKEKTVEYLIPSASYEDELELFSIILESGLNHKDFSLTHSVAQNKDTNFYEIVCEHANDASIEACKFVDENDAYEYLLAYHLKDQQTM